MWEVLGRLWVPFGLTCEERSLLFSMFSLVKSWRGLSAVLAGVVLPMMPVAGVASAAPMAIVTVTPQVTGVAKRMSDTHSFEVWVQNTGTGDLSQAMLKGSLYVPSTATVSAVEGATCSELATSGRDAAYTCALDAPEDLPANGFVQLATVTDSDHEWGVIDTAGRSGERLMAAMVSDSQSGGGEGRRGRPEVVVARVVPAVDDDTAQALEGDVLGSCCCCCCSP